MPLLRDLSIRTKLILLTTVCSALALSLSTLGFAINNIGTLRTSKVEQLRSQARMLGFNSTAVLTFRDPLGAAQLLESFQLLPMVELACLYDATGQVLAEYRRDHVAAAVPAEIGNGFRFTNTDIVEGFEPVIDDGEVVGTLYLRASLLELHEQLLEYMRTLAVVLVGSLFASVVSSMMLQQAISRPLT